jgi:hypothetical protein
MRDYIAVYLVQMEPDPANGIFGVQPPPVFGTVRYSVFFADQNAADDWIANVFPFYSSIFLPPSSPARWYFMLDKEKFIGWLNVAGIYNALTFDEGVAPDNYTQIPPRGSGVNSITEKSPNYGGATASSGSHSGGTLTMSIGGYLELIYEQLLAKGAIAHAQMVKQILDDWTARKITDAEALTRLDAVSRLL